MLYNHQPYAQQLRESVLEARPGRKFADHMRTCFSKNFTLRENDYRRYRARLDLAILKALRELQGAGK